MILFKQIELLQRIHKLIDLSHTGSPKQFAKRLGISESRLYRIIDEMKDLNVPIDYSRQNETYFYLEPFEMDISCTFRRLTDKEQKNISAGIPFFSNFFFTAFFVQ
jgi:predicted DNA-binding transcriptional regulator YafY